MLPKSNAHLVKLGCAIVICFQISIFNSAFFGRCC
nr:MAG TPA: hypothetical protein [Bacteriophage sp.]